jgi:superfamily II DNA or RNA helicase
MEFEDQFEPPELRPAQRDALAAIDSFLAGEEQHGIIKMFCGTGKSRIMLECVEFAERGSISAIVVPSIALITQFAQDYVLKYGVTERCSVMCICSDNELPRQGSGRSDICYTTSKQRICSFLKQRQHDLAAADTAVPTAAAAAAAATTTQLLLVTYQSFPTFYAAVKEEQVQVQLLMFDEAHHITANEVGCRLRLQCLQRLVSKVVQ